MLDGIASSPKGGAKCRSVFKFDETESKIAKGSLTRGNSTNHRQWRMKGVAVGAAASKTERLNTGQLFLCPTSPSLLTQCHLS